MLKLFLEVVVKDPLRLQSHLRAKLEEGDNLFPSSLMCFQAVIPHHVGLSTGLLTYMAASFPKMTQEKAYEATFFCIT